MFHRSILNSMYNGGMDLSGLPRTNHKTIPPEYLDLMGHMNVMWYMHLFDYGTRTLFRSFDFGEDYVERTKMGSFALEAHIRYLNEVRVGQTVSVYSRLLGRSAKTLHFMHFMLREEGQQLAATIEVLTAHADLTRRKITPYPPEVLAKIDPMLHTHQALDWDAPVSGTMGIRKK